MSTVVYLTKSCLDSCWDQSVGGGGGGGEGGEGVSSRSRNREGIAVHVIIVTRCDSW